MNSYDDVIEYILLSQMNVDERENDFQVPVPKKTRKRYVRLEISRLSEKQCKQMFRFTVNEIQRICDALKLEHTLRFPHLKVESQFAMAMLLYNYSFPRRLCDMGDFFGMSDKNVSKVLNRTTELILSKIRYGLQFDERQFSLKNCERFSKVIFEGGAFYDHIIGFIDGPTDNNEQENMCNGWKHMQCNKFQAISTPDGITSSLCGPYVGRRNDMEMLNKSEIQSTLTKRLEAISPNKTYAIYGNQDYTTSKHLVCPHSKSYITEFEKETNLSLSKVRVAIEKESGKVAQYFSSCKWKYGNKGGQTTPARKYVIATLFKNFYTCINGSAVTTTFGLDPPSLEEYVEGLMRPRNEYDTTTD